MEVHLKLVIFGGRKKLKCVDIRKTSLNWGYLIDGVGHRVASRGGYISCPPKRKVSLKRPFAPKMSNKGLK